MIGRLADSGLIRAVRVAWAAWRDERAVAPRPQPAAVRGFLPGVVEIQDSPPPRFLVMLPALLLVFLVALVLWAWVGRQDIVSVAQGRLVPSRPTVVVQAASSGVVRDIAIADGTMVARGDPLIALDPTEARVDLERLEADRAASAMEVARLDALLEALRRDATPTALFVPPPDAAPDAAAEAWERLEGDWAAFRREEAGAEREVVRLRAVRATTEAQIVKLQATLPISRELVATQQELRAKELVAKSTLLQLQRALIETEGDLVVLRSTVTQNAAEIAVAEENLERVRADFRAARLAERGAAGREAERAALELAKARERQSRRTLLAPAAGTVQELTVHTVGAVVREGDPLLKIVPADAELMVEARVANKDVGYVRPGQPVQVKIEGYPYVSHGTLAGTIETVSAEAKQGYGESTAAAAAGGAGNAAPGGPPPQPYAARIRLDPDSIARFRDGDHRPLAPGMAVTVDIKTGERRLIEYLLAPVLKYRQESLRER